MHQAVLPFCMLSASCAGTGYLDALGTAMLMLCQAVPHGVLCFFPSWGLLNAARDQWLVTGDPTCLQCAEAVCMYGHWWSMHL